MLKGRTVLIINLVLAFFSACLFLVLGILFVCTNAFEDFSTKEYRTVFGVIILAYTVLKFYRFYKKLKEYKIENEIVE
jgi:hypothetical protein